MEGMELLINLDTVSTLVKQYLMEWIGYPFLCGLGLGAALEMFGYGIFKAVSLLNIKY